MKHKKLRKFLAYSGIFLFALFVVFVTWQLSKKVPTDGDWKPTLKLLSTATFKGDTVTVKNVRNFQYDAKGDPTIQEYYDKTYDLKKLKRTWYVSDPFHPGSLFSHTFLSFEFSDNSYLAITIEGRLTEGQEYNAINGTIRTFPLIYIAADERDVIYLRTNVYKNQVYMYPIRATPTQSRLLLVDLLERMNELSVHPAWYNSIFDNCTSAIAHHVNKIWPGLLPRFDWQSVLTSYADEMVIHRNLIDTSLSVSEARRKFYVTDLAQKIGYVGDFSALLRKAIDDNTNN